MSSSRIEHFKENLYKLHLLMVEQDSKTKNIIQNVLRAMGRFENYREKSTGIENLISKLNVYPPLYESLKTIHQILIAEVKENNDIFKSGNSFWDALTTEGNKQEVINPNLRDEEITKFLEKLTETIQETINDIEINELQTLKEMTEKLDYLHKELVISGLSIFSDIEARILSPNIRKTQNENYDKIKKNILIKFYQMLILALKKLKTSQEIQLNTNEYTNLYQYFSLWLAIATPKLLDENAEMQLMMQTLVSQFGRCGFKQRNVVQVSLPSTVLTEAIKKGSYKARVIIDTRDFNKSRNEHPDLTFENRILPHHGFLGTATFSPAEGYKPNSLHNFLSENLFLEAADFYSRIEELMPKNIFESNDKLRKIYASLKIIPQLLGIWQDDKIPLRSFHFIRFANKLVAQIKKIQLENLNQTELKLFITATENAWATLIRLAHRDIPPDIAATMDLYSNKFQLSEREIFYYKLVEEQQYLFLVAEFVVVFSYLKIDEITQPMTQELIKEHFNLDQTNLAGICDLVLNRCKLLEENLVATKFYKSPNKIFTQQDVLLADNRMKALLESLEQEEKLIVNQANEKLASDKKRYRTGIKNCRKVLSRFFKTESNAASSSPPIEECKEAAISKQQELYLIAGRLRQSTDVISEAAINKYLEVVIPFENNSIDVDQAYDYFYVAASYAELADCFIRKADEKVPNNYANGDFNFVSLIQEEYNKALKFAQNAYRCFIEKTEPRVNELTAEQLKDFHDLSKHIKFILKSAEEKLHSFMQFCEQSFIQLQEAQKKLQQGRLEAMRRFTREEWVNRCNPSNFYSNLHKSNQQKIANLLQSHHEIKTHLNNELKPIGSRFTYLVGGIEPPFPLLTSSEKEDELPVERSNDFVARLKKAAMNDKLLKPGNIHHQEERLRLTA